jgi:hypothetical protein
MSSNETDLAVSVVSSAPFLANLFLYLFDADFTQELLKNNKKKLARFCYFTFRYDVLILHNSKFDDYVDPSIQLSFGCIEYTSPELDSN